MRPETVDIGSGQESRTSICDLATPQRCSVVAGLWETVVKDKDRMLILLVPLGWRQLGLIHQSV